MSEVSTLVLAAQAGDARAFGEIAARFYGIARAAAIDRTGDPTLSEDAVQEAFVEAFLHLKRLKDPQAFPSWFRQIVLRQCSRLTRGQLSLETPLQDMEDLPSEEMGPDEALLQQERSDRIRLAVEGLPERERLAVHLYYEEGLALREVAQRLRAPESAIKRRLQSARERLRRAMLEELSRDEATPGSVGAL